MTRDRFAVALGEQREVVLTKCLTRTRLVQYAGASGDYNPIHTDEVFATQVGGHRSVFAHGMLVMGMAGTVVSGWFGVARVEVFSARFVRQVWPGDRLVATAVVTSLDVPDRPGRALLELVVVNQDGDRVLDGTAVVRVDDEEVR